MFEGIQIDCYGNTDIGKVREANEDQFLIAELHKLLDVKSTSLSSDHQRQLISGTTGLLLLVADGVGGGPGGAEAAEWALDAIVQFATNSM